MQYIRIKFQPWDTREWTYIWSGTPFDFKPGDCVEVKTPKKGLELVEVVGVSDTRPADVPANVQLKAIVRIVPQRRGVTAP